VSVINTTAHGKALKVRFREGYDGPRRRELQRLSRPLRFVGRRGVRHERGRHRRRSDRDERQFVHGAGPFPLAPVPGTLHALTFSNRELQPGRLRHADRNRSRSHESCAHTAKDSSRSSRWARVVDQASGSQETLKAITPVNGTPPGCGAGFANAWANGGYWTTSAGHRPVAACQAASTGAAGACQLSPKARCTPTTRRRSMVFSDCRAALRAWQFQAEPRQCGDRLCAWRYDRLCSDRQRDDQV